MITAQVESFQNALPELTRLFPQHWSELALFKDRMPLAPQYQEYVWREHAGSLFLTTVRRNGKIVAYYVAQVAPGFHYGTTLTAHMDIMYIVPEAKGLGLSLPLMRAVRAELRRRRVQVWYSGWKTATPNGMDRLHELFGFQPADTHVALWIGQNP